MELLAQVLAGAIIGAGIGAVDAAGKEAERGGRTAATVAIITLCVLLLGVFMAWHARQISEPRWKAHQYRYQVQEADDVIKAIKKPCP